jgi:hypothetical protein
VIVFVAALGARGNMGINKYLVIEDPRVSMAQILNYIGVLGKLRCFMDNFYYYAIWEHFRY